MNGDTVQNLAASCDTLVNQSDELLKAGNSDYYSINSSTVSICGSDSNLLNSCSSSEARSSSIDITQVVDENDNIDMMVGPAGASSTSHWGEMSHSPVQEGQAGELQERELTADRHLDHDYSRGELSKDPDLLGWYCLSTC